MWRSRCTLNTGQSRPSVSRLRSSASIRLGQFRPHDGQHGGCASLSRVAALMHEGDELAPGVMGRQESLSGFARCPVFRPLSKRSRHFLRVAALLSAIRRLTDAMVLSSWATPSLPSSRGRVVKTHTHRVERDRGHQPSGGFGGHHPHSACGFGTAKTVRGEQPVLSHIVPAASVICRRRFVIPTGGAG